MIPFRAAMKVRRWINFRDALKIARASKAQGIGYALGFALVDQESGFRHIFGHDNSFLAGLPVTEERYRKLQRHIRAGGASNGVGFTQITYPTYITGHNGLWDKVNNLNFGFHLIAENIRQYGLEKGLAVYNGGAGNPQYAYANEVLALRRKWAGRL